MARVVLEPIVGLNSMFLISGERHKRERRLLMPAFHGERMRAYGALMQQCTRMALEALRPGAALVALDVTQSILPSRCAGTWWPAGMGVVASVTLAHSNPAIFPEPEQFRPERFLERKFSPFEYLPFGGGARRCLGAAFALYEMKVVLGTMLSAHRFSLVHDRPIRPVRRNVTLAPEDGVPLRYEGLVPGASAAA